MSKGTFIAEDSDMAESTIPTPPQTPPFAAPSSEPESFPRVSLRRLDNLLETYLELLDEYTTLRTQLSKQFSDGFFALARANHMSANLGSGRRYGEEGYDERMKAQRRIVYSVEDSRLGHERNGTDIEDVDSHSEAEKKPQVAAQPGCRISIQKTKDIAVLDKTSTSHPENESVAGESSTSAHTADSAHRPPPSAKSESSSETTAKVEAKPPPSDRDPLKWYGILIPLPLRQAQASFIPAVETSIPELLNVCAAMHELEIRVTKLRVKLGLRPGPESDQNADENTQTQEEGFSTTSPSSQSTKAAKEAAQISSSPRKRLVQRPSEPRSRILKLDG